MNNNEMTAAVTRMTTEMSAEELERHGTFIVALSQAVLDAYGEQAGDLVRDVGSAVLDEAQRREEEWEQLCVGAEDDGDPIGAQVDEDVRPPDDW